MDEIEFNVENLSNIFKNINHKPCSVIGYDFAFDVLDNEKFVGELFYSKEDKEWFFIKDNFPRQRKAYRISFPVKSPDLLIHLFDSIGIKLIIYSKGLL